MALRFVKLIVSMYPSVDDDIETTKVSQVITAKISDEEIMIVKGFIEKFGGERIGN